MDFPCDTVICYADLLDIHDRYTVGLFVELSSILRPTHLNRFESDSITRRQSTNDYDSCMLSDLHIRTVIRCVYDCSILLYIFILLFLTLLY